VGGGLRIQIKTFRQTIHVDKEGRALQQARKKREAYRNFNGFRNVKIMDKILNLPSLLREKDLVKSKCLSFLKQSANQTQRLNLRIPS